MNNSLSVQSFLRAFSKKQYWITCTSSSIKSSVKTLAIWSIIMTSPAFHLPSCVNSKFTMFASYCNYICSCTSKFSPTLSLSIRSYYLGPHNQYKNPSKFIQHNIWISLSLLLKKNEMKNHEKLLCIHMNKTPKMYFFRKPTLLTIWEVTSITKTSS